VAVSPDGATLYAVNSGPGTVTALDTATGAIRWGPLAVGKNASEAVATTDGKKLYVSVRHEDLVQVVDLSNPAAPRVLDSAVAVGDQPDTLQLTPERRTLVVALRASPAQVDLVDTRSLGVRSVQIPGAATTGHQALSPDGAFTFVAVEGPESVAGLAIIDNREALRPQTPRGGAA
jgi:DNA-binding beta-propeller fold protein YncE